MPDTASAPAPFAPPRPEDLATFYVSLLYPGPAYDGFPPASPEQQAVLHAHVAHVLGVQRDGGPAVAGGPLMSDGADATLPIGLTILRAQSLEHAARLAGEDPGVAAGRFRVAVLPWLVPHGRLPA